MIYQPTDAFPELDFAKYARTMRRNGFLKQWASMMSVSRAIEDGFRYLYNVHLCDCHVLPTGEIGCSKHCEGHR